MKENWGNCRKCGRTLDVLVNVPTCERCDWGKFGGPSAGCGPFYVILSPAEHVGICNGNPLSCVLYRDKGDAEEFNDSMGAHEYFAQEVMTLDVPTFEYNDLYCGMISPVMVLVHDRRPAVVDEYKAMSLAWLI